MISVQLLEHWSTMTSEEILIEGIIFFSLMIILLVISHISDYIKEEYEDEISKSSNKVLKFIFKYIL